MRWWPFGRRDAPPGPHPDEVSRPVEVPRPRGEWRALPALQPVAAVDPRVAADEGWRAELSSGWKVPPALAPLGHDVSLSAPSGLAPMQLTAVQGYPDAPELHWRALPAGPDPAADEGSETTDEPSRSFLGLDPITPPSRDQGTHPLPAGRDADESRRDQGTRPLLADLAAAEPHRDQGARPLVTERSVAESRREQGTRPLLADRASAPLLRDHASPPPLADRAGLPSRRDQGSHPLPAPRPPRDLAGDVRDHGDGLREAQRDDARPTHVAVGAETDLADERRVEGKVVDRADSESTKVESLVARWQQSASDVAATAQVSIRGLQSAADAVLSERSSPSELGAAAALELGTPPVALRWPNPETSGPAGSADQAQRVAARPRSDTTSTPPARRSLVGERMSHPRWDLRPPATDLEAAGDAASDEAHSPDDPWADSEPMPASTRSSSAATSADLTAVAASAGLPADLAWMASTGGDADDRLVWDATSALPATEPLGQTAQAAQPAQSSDAEDPLSSPMWTSAPDVDATSSANVHIRGDGDRAVASADGFVFRPARRRRAMQVGMPAPRREVIDRSEVPSGLLDRRRVPDDAAADPSEPTLETQDQHSGGVDGQRPGDGEMGATERPPALAQPSVDADAMADQMYERIRGRLRHELLIDRERSLLLTDLR